MSREIYSDIAGNTVIKCDEQEKGFKSRRILILKCEFYLGSNFIHSVLPRYFSVQPTRLSMMLWIAGDSPIAGGDPLEDELLADCNAAISWLSPSVMFCSEAGDEPTRMSSATAPSTSSPPFSDSEPTRFVCFRSLARLKQYLEKQFFFQNENWRQKLNKNNILLKLVNINVE